MKQLISFILYKFCYELPLLIIGTPYSMVFGHEMWETPEMVAEKERLERVKNGGPEVLPPPKYPRLFAAWYWFNLSFKCLFCVIIYYAIAEHLFKYLGGFLPVHHAADTGGLL